VKLAIESSDDAVRGALQHGLHEFNMASTPEASWDNFVVTVRDDAGALHGGVTAHIFAASCYIDTVFIDEAARRDGLGTRMIRMAEDEARRLGARGVWLYTTSFQAKPFYEKLGYAEFAELKWPGSAVLRHFLKKEL
jgi:GNAT superfamily N-acetyltransferase